MIEDNCAILLPFGIRIRLARLVLLFTWGWKLTSPVTLFLDIRRWCPRVKFFGTRCLMNWPPYCFLALSSSQKAFLLQNVNIILVTMSRTLPLTQTYQLALHVSSHKISVRQHSSHDFNGIIGSLLCNPEYITLIIFLNALWCHDDRIRSHSAGSQSPLDFLQVGIAVFLFRKRFIWVCKRMVIHCLEFVGGCVFYLRIAVLRL